MTRALKFTIITEGRRRVRSVRARLSCRPTTRSDESEFAEIQNALNEKRNFTPFQPMYQKNRNPRTNSKTERKSVRNGEQCLLIGCSLRLKKGCVFAGNGPAKLSELRKLTIERVVRFGDSCEVPSFLSLFSALSSCEHGVMFVWSLAACTGKPVSCTRLRSRCSEPG